MSTLLHLPATLNLCEDLDGTAFAEACRRAALAGAHEARENPKLHHPRMKSKRIAERFGCISWRNMHDDILFRVYKAAFAGVALQMPRSRNPRLVWTYPAQHLFRVSYYDRESGTQAELTVDVADHAVRGKWSVVLYRGTDDQGFRSVVAKGQGGAKNAAQGQRKARLALIKILDDQFPVKAK